MYYCISICCVLCKVREFITFDVLVSVYNTHHDTHNTHHNAHNTHTTTQSTSQLLSDIAAAAASKCQKFTARYINFLLVQESDLVPGECVKVVHACISKLQPSRESSAAVDKVKVCVCALCVCVCIHVCMHFVCVCVQCVCVCVCVHIQVVYVCACVCFGGVCGVCVCVCVCAYCY